VPVGFSRYRNERVPHVEARTKCISSAPPVLCRLQGEPSAATGQRTARPGRTTSAVDSVSGAQKRIITQRQPKTPPTAATVITASSSVSIGSLRIELCAAYIGRSPPCSSFTHLLKPTHGGQAGEVCFTGCGWRSERAIGLFACSCSSLLLQNVRLLTDCGL
jgi:hypothetical protein